jgi:hypothetical protein
MDLGKLVSDLGAGLLGTVLGNPLALGSTVGNLVGNVFNVPQDKRTDPAEYVSAINADPDKVIKLRQIEVEAQGAIIAFLQKSDELYFADIKSARWREIETTKATGSRDWNLVSLAWAIVLSAIGGSVWLLTIIKGTPDPAVRDLTFIIVGYLFSQSQQVTGYFFGSSASSKAKDSTMADLANRGQTVATQVQAVQKTLDLKKA